MSSRDTSPHLCEVAAKLGACASAVSNWCAVKHLQLNAKKTEVMWFGSATNLRKLSSADQHLKVGPDNVSPSTVVRDLVSSSTLN